MDTILTIDKGVDFIMKYNSGILFFLLAVLSLGAYDLETPALTPVTFATPANHAPLLFIKNGELNFAIGYDQQAEAHATCKKSITPAVTFLQDTFEKCTGRRPTAFDVSKQDALANNKLVLYVGDCLSTRNAGIVAQSLPDQGFVIKSFANGVMIVGRDSSLIEDYDRDPVDNRRGASRGTFYGVLDFAERILGARFFFPGKFGSYFPVIDTLMIAPMHYSDYPRFNTRGSTYFLWGALKDDKMVQYWEPYLGKLPVGDTSFSDFLRIGGTVPRAGSHCPTPEKLAEAYPDQLKTIFYTSPSGKFWYNPKQHIGNYFNVVDLGFADLLIDAWKAYFASTGKDDRGLFHYWCGRSALSFGVCDTNLPAGDIIHHPTVQQLSLISEEDFKRGEFALMSNIYGRFYQYLGQRIQKEFPGSKLYILAYYNSTFAPRDEKWRLPENIEINLCDFRLPLKTRNPDEMEKTLSMFREWYEALGNRPVQKVWLYNSRSTPFARALAGEFVKDVPAVLGKYLGREEMFFDFDGVHDLWHYYTSVYALHRSMWNPDWDVDAGIDEHWNLFYGREAGPLLKDFHQGLKKIFLTILAPSLEYSPAIPIGELEPLEKLLETARKKLAAGSIEQQRFNLFSAPWQKNFEAQRVRHAYERPVYQVRRLLPNEKITLDGVPEETFWQKSPQMVLRDPKGSATPPAFPVSVRLAWDDKGIYGAVNASYGPLADTKNSLWANCNFELFFSPGMSKEQIYQIAFDPLSQFHTSKHRLLPIPQPIDLTWMAPGKQLKSQFDKASLKMEFYIPFADFEEVPPKVYDSWYFNLVRNKVIAPKEYSGTALSLGINANLNMFGLITFAGKGDIE